MRKPAWLTPTLLPAILVLSFAGCATRPSEPEPPAPSPPPPPAVVCPAIPAYTAEFQAALADRLEALPTTDPVRIAIDDYGALRARIRAACPDARRTP